MIKDELRQSSTLSAEKRNKLKRFTDSEWWCTRFTKRRLLTSKVLYGQVGSTDIEGAKDKMRKIRAWPSIYSLKDIYNIDETALFYEMLPWHTYILNVENKNYLRGTKKMKAKDRVTAYIGTNADGSAKVPISIIGVSRNPRAFKGGEPACKYFHSKKAWSNPLLFQQWLDEVFVPHVCRQPSRKVALLIDNASSHDKIVLTSRIELISLPSNVTSLYQPMDMGIIRAWKICYRKSMLRGLLQHVESMNERKMAK